MVSSVRQRVQAPCSGETTHTACGGQAPLVDDLALTKLLELEASVMVGHLLPFVFKEHFKDVLDRALNAFIPDHLPSPLDAERVFILFFIPWLLFNWVVPKTMSVPGIGVDETLALYYLNQHRAALTLEEQRFIELATHSYHSIYRLLEVVPGQSLIVKDLLLGTVHTVGDREGAHGLKSGDVVFGQLLTVEGTCLFLGRAPWVFSQGDLVDLGDFYDRLVEKNQGPLTATALRTFGAALVTYFFESVAQCEAVSDPFLLNGEGHVIDYETSYFTLTLSPEEALERLLPLTGLSEPAAMLENAHYDESGALVGIGFPWLHRQPGFGLHHPQKSTTIRGYFTLSGDRLLLDTNSQERTEQGKQWLKRYLGSRVVFERTVKVSEHNPGRVLEAKGSSPLFNGASQRRLADERCFIGRVVTDDCARWLDEPLAALNHQTPRDASTTARGRTQLEGVLWAYEAALLRLEGGSLLKSEMKEVRAALGLVPAGSSH